MKKAPVVLALALLLSAAAHAAPAGKSADRRAAARARAAFAESWNFYKWRIERGDSLAQLEDVLLRIRRKYGAALPGRMTMVERELAAVSSLRSLSRQNADAVGGE